MMHRFFLIVVLSLVSIKGIACKCDGSSSVDEATNHAELVVIGKMIKKNLVTLSETMNADKLASLKAKKNKEYWLNALTVVKVEIEVIKLYKGKAHSNRVIVYTPEQSASCGFQEFEEGKIYAVYGTKESLMYGFITSDKNKREGLEKAGTYWTHRCSRTTGLYQAEMKELDKIKR